MISPIKLTMVVLVAVSAFLIGYDIWVATNSIDNTLDTISGRMRLWGSETAFFPYVYSVMAGHFWGPWRSGDIVNFDFVMSMFFLILIAGAVSGIDAVLKQNSINVSMWVWIPVGVLAGAICWPQ